MLVQRTTRGEARCDEISVGESREVPAISLDPRIHRVFVLATREHEDDWDIAAGHLVHEELVVLLLVLGESARLGDVNQQAEPVPRVVEELNQLLDRDVRWNGPGVSLMKPDRVDELDLPATVFKPTIDVGLGSDSLRPVVGRSCAAGQDIAEACLADTGLAKNEHSREFRLLHFCPSRLHC